MRELLSRVHQVADTNATVIVQRDTGTGNEVVARKLHEISARRDEPFVPVSCVALPRPLLEAELFGYEEGAFTGAKRQRIGRIEHASGGTLFLDDADDIPMAVQVKLLRVLQEHEVQRIGAEERNRVNIRVISASKRDLQGREEISMEEVMGEVEARLISWAREKSDGNLSEAARRLGVPRSTLQYKIEKKPKRTPEDPSSE